jgi:hypothetical protein
MLAKLKATIARVLLSGLTLVGVRERGVQVEDHLGEALGGMLFAILVKNIELNGPFLHRASFHNRRLVAVSC